MRELFSGLPAVLVFLPSQNPIDWMKQQIPISPSLGGWEVYDQGVASWVVGEGSVPGLQVSTFLLHPHIVFSVCVGVISLLFLF